MCGVEKIIFHRVSGPKKFHILKTRNPPQRSDLNVLRQAGAEPIHIHLNGFPPFRFNKQLVRIFGVKALNFIFYAWAIPWTETLNSTIEHGGSIEPFSEQIVDIAVGVSDVAASLGVELGCIGE